MEYKFTDENFEAEVKNSDLPVMVDLYTDWCGPCKAMAPMVSEFADAYDGKIKIGKMNAEENANVASEFHVMSIPTFLFFKNGELVDTVIGGIPKSVMKEKLENLL